MSGKDIATIEERTRDRVREVFAGLLTDQELDQLVKKAYDKFFNEPSETVIIQKQVRDGGFAQPHKKVLETTGVKASPFEVICFDFFALEVNKKLTELFQGPEMTASIEHHWVKGDFETQDGSSKFHNNATVTRLGEELQKRSEQMAKDNAHLFFQQMFANYLSMSRTELINDIHNVLNDPNRNY